MHSSPQGLSGLLSSRVKRVRIKKALATIGAGESLLDLGCGLGEIVKGLPGGVDYLGVERDPYMVEFCRERYPERSFLSADFLRDALPAGPWDTILLLAVLEHLEKPERLLKRVVPIVAEGGSIIVTTPHPRGAGLHAFLSRLHILSSMAGDEHEELLDRSALERMADQAGLKMTHYETFLFGLNQFALLVRV